MHGCMLSHVRLFCDPVDYSLPGSSVRGIFQARILEQDAISSPGDLPDPGIKPSSPVLWPWIISRFQYFFLFLDCLKSQTPGLSESKLYSFWRGENDRVCYTQYSICNLIYIEILLLVKKKHKFVVPLLSHVQLFATPWSIAPASSVLHYLLEFAQICVH